ncbi:histidine kinase [Mumia zhuanghuii]|uniref:sensor histidine kinase n=1 Tax=Mumia zhuanghuii TaxID=2585211 RepID=UPI00362A6562
MSWTNGGGLHARAVTVAVLGAFVAVYLVAAGSDLPWVAPLVVGALVLHLRFLLPGWPHGPLVSVVQAALLYGAVLGFGVSVGVLGLAIGALWLEGRRAAAVAVAVSAPAIAAVEEGWSRAVIDVSISAWLIGIVAYGLTRLTYDVDEVQSTRLTLAAAAVREERLRIAAGLRGVIEDGLTAMARAARRPSELGDALAEARSSLDAARTAASEMRELSLAPQVSAAQGMLEAAGAEVTVRTGHREPLGPGGSLLAAVLREAVTDAVRDRACHCLIETIQDDGEVRLTVVADGARTTERGEAALEPLAVRLAAAGGRLDVDLDADGRIRVVASLRVAEEAAPVSDQQRFATALLAVVLVGFCGKALLQLSGVELLVALPLLAVVCLLNLRLRSPWLLPLQAVIAFVPVVWLGSAWGGVAGFLAGALLVSLPPRAAWPLVGTTMVGVFATQSAVGTAPPLTVNLTISVLVTGLVVFGLARLAVLADELHAAHDGLVRAAVVQERLRAARDLHDLLGHTFAAMILKGELVRRLLDRDPDRASAELDEIAAIAVRARADMATVVGEAPRLELASEVEAAGSVLRAAGIATTVEASVSAVDGERAAAFIAVLREAVTNVLRHSAAKEARITVDGSQLVVENDGVPAEITSPGAGIGNLRTRVAALGGTLDAGPVGDGRFRVTAAVDR